MGVLAGIATGPGAIVTGLVGGIIGGFFGAKAAGMVSNAMISKMTIDFDFESRNKQPGSPPNIRIKAKPGKTVGFFSYMEIDGSIYWAEARTADYSSPKTIHPYPGIPDNIKATFVTLALLEEYKDMERLKDRAKEIILARATKDVCT